MAQCRGRAPPLLLRGKPRPRFYANCVEGSTVTWQALMGAGGGGAGGGREDTYL